MKSTPRTLALTVVFALTAACSGEPPLRPAGPDKPPVDVGAVGGKADGFDWGSACRAGSGSFTQPIAKDAVVTVGKIPAGRVGVMIKLTSPEDVDIQLFDEDGDVAVVQWPDGLLKGAGEQTTTYKGVTITWSGYNGDGQNLGHEYIKLEGETPTTFVMKAYGYAAGAAQVDYEWAAKPDCKDEGKGSFEQAIEKDAVVVVGTIPKGLSNVKIKLTSPVDIDVQLYDAVDGAALVKWPDGLLDGEGKQTLDHAGFKIVWSGYNGDGTGKGNEYIEIIGETTKSLVMKVFGYEAGTAKVDYSWGGGGDATPLEADVIFAPAQRHEDKVIERIKAAQFSIDIAMYNMKHTGVFNALKDAIEKKNVKVRVIYHGAQTDRKDPAGTRSAKMEDLGIDVRYATKSKVMHHKFMIVDGPRRGDDGQPVLDRATTAWLVSGSGNWALGNHDENTLFMRGVPELVLHFQREFNRLWTWSWDFEWKSYTKDEAATLDPTSFVDDPAQACFFTSANMKENMSFTVDKSKETVGQAIAAELQKATTSIEIASGHMRSKTVYDALVAIKNTKPKVKIRVYLDGQEYTTSDYKDYYGYRLHAAGIDVKFKYYAYRWDYTYAPQMHNKYFIIDGRKVLTGSYNLSDNAEWNSLENIIFIEGDAFAPVVAKYQGDFARLWNTDADGSMLQTLEHEIKTYNNIPLVFPAMALSHPQIKALKVLIEDNCPQAWKGDYNYCSSDSQCDTARGLTCDTAIKRCVNPLYDADFGKNPRRHKSCPRL